MRKNQRQLKYSRLQRYSFKKLVPEKNNEGVTTETFPGDAFMVKGEVWPATTKLQLETYGSRLSGISNMRVVGKDLNLIVNEDCEYIIVITADGGTDGLATEQVYTIEQGDGVYIFADPETQDPDFRVLSITPYNPVKLEIERR